MYLPGNPYSYGRIFSSTPAQNIFLAQRVRSVVNPEPDQCLVHVAPAPAIAELTGPDELVVRLGKLLCSVPLLARVATVYVAAGEAFSQKRLGPLLAGTPPALREGCTP